MEYDIQLRSIKARIGRLGLDVLGHALGVNARRPAITWVVVWLAAAVGTTFGVCGSWGFNPTDEGVTLAWSQRILLGQIPHRDFILQAPAGSGLLHIIDLLIPGPTLFISRAIALFELALATWLLGHFSVGWPAATRKRILLTIAISLSFLANLNTFPIMAWYTIDGIFACSIGLILIGEDPRPTSRWRYRCGLLMLGAAPLFKSNFALMAALGVAYTFKRNRNRVVSRRVALDIGFLASPSLAYGGWVGLHGGLLPFVHQLTTRAISINWIAGLDVTGTIGTSLQAGTTLAVGIVMVLLIINILIWHGAIRRQMTGSWKLPATAISLCVVTLPLVDRLQIEGVWSAWMLWACALVTVIAKKAKQPYWRLMSLTLLGFTVSLSNGAPAASLVGGSLALAVVGFVWCYSRIHLPGMDDTSSRPWARPDVIGAAFLLLAVSLVCFYTRGQHVYRDRPADELQSSLEAISPKFGGIRTNPVTYTYISDIAACIREHPTQMVAMIPDNPGLYVALGVHSPLADSWAEPFDYGSDVSRFNESVHDLYRRNSYLVIFQPVFAPGLSELAQLPRMTSAASIGYVPPGGEYVHQLYATLPGERISCGHLLAIYASGDTPTGNGPPK